jgi:very-short-patch-repair endonuclease
MLIFSKIRIADIVSVDNMHENYGYWNKIRSKHIDFLLCTPDSTPFLCIELDGYSHQQSRVRENDKFKDELFDTLGIRCLRYRVSQKYDFNEIIELVNAKMTV